MSSANTIGASWGGFPHQALAKEYGSFTLPSPASPLVVPETTILASDKVVISFVAGGVPATGPPAVTIQPGVSFTVTPAGAVASPAFYNYQIIKGA